MKKIGIIANCKKGRAKDVIAKLVDKASKLGMEVYVDKETSEIAPQIPSLTHEEMFSCVEAVMALGGDGTMLRLVRELNRNDKPVIGFNIGGLGFLTSVTEDDMDMALQYLLEDDYILSERTVAEAIVYHENELQNKYRGLNDIVLKSGSSRLVNLELVVDNERVSTYACDGLILSTPTGSTGYSLSSGGPILSPKSKVFVICVICPHTLSSRPLVIPDESSIVITALPGSEPMLLSVDGQVGQSIDEGDRVEIGKFDKSVKLIHLPYSSYYSVLRQKLGWSGSAL